MICGGNSGHAIGLFVAGARRLGPQTDLFTITPDNELLWDGKPVVTRRAFDLTWWQIALAGITAGSAFVVAAVELASFLGYGGN